MAYTPQIYYPASYQQQYQGNYQPMPQTPQPQSNNQGLIWVSGEIGAKSYLVAPNTTVMLMDSEGNKFYIKSTDSAGMPTLRAYEYSEIVQQAQTMAQNISSEQYVTRHEYEELLAKIEDLQKAKTPAKKKAEVTENE